MTVHHEVWALARALGRGGGDDRMKVGGVLPGLEADGAAMLHHPDRRGPHILGVMALRRNTRQTQILAELLLKASAVGAKIIQDRLHAHGV